ncbi:hypothetical protein Hdeb2414_s0014g00422831 [Helianthus debilis subsp. tardiflorus]
MEGGRLLEFDDKGPNAGSLWGDISPIRRDSSDALAGYVSMFADWFVLQYPLSQPSQLGMVHARHFEYLFRSHNIVPLVEDFRRFYQMTVTLGFFSFSLRKVSPKLMTAPKGLTKWKAKFFYVKEAAVTCKLHFRNMTGNIATKQLSTPGVGEQAWLGYIRVVPLKALGNRQLQYLHMMLWGKPGQKTKLVLKENGEGNLGDLGDREAKGVPAAPAVILVDKQKRKKRRRITLLLFHKWYRVHQIPSALVFVNLRLRDNV